MSMHKISVTINGAEHEAEVESRLLLVHLIRENLRLTGTHIGCDTTHCGACTVLARRRAGEVVHRARGPGRRARRSPRSRGSSRTASCTRCRRASAEKHGLQCGFCTPGMLMTA